MASRPVFIPLRVGQHLVRMALIEFDWIPGMSLSQSRKRIDALHEATRKRLRISRILEVSSKSADQLGTALSAFNLRLQDPDGLHPTVESAYQGSKVFAGAGPFHDIYRMPSIDAKRDDRVRNGGAIVGFRYHCDEWPTVPRSAFYDWLYVTALSQNRELSNEVAGYDCFTDIAFNPEKSFNCQARAVALCVSLQWRGALDRALKSQEAFLETLGRVPTLDDEQPDLIG
jgi:hypothetical protein